MDATLQQQTVFHLTGRRPEAPLEAVDGLSLRPALMARYRDLGKLRYDFPVVLVDTPDGNVCARPLNEVVNEAARSVAPAGPSGEALRKHLLHVEREIRSALPEGAEGRLSQLWIDAVLSVTQSRDQDLVDLLLHAGESLSVDGELVDCDQAMPGRLLRHAWQSVQRHKLARVRADINALVARLNDILRADFVRSEAGLKAESLRSAVGQKHQGLFDFDKMSRLLSLGWPASRLSGRSRRRIEWSLGVLRTQRFFPPLPGTVAPAGAEAPYEFAFDSCRGALAAFRERLPGMAELVKAMSIAELEGDGRYDESRHNGFFDAFDSGSLSPQDLEIFPSYFVHLRGKRPGAAADTNLMELLSSGMPAKVLVENDDILQESSLGQGHFAFGVRSVQLASLATGLNDTFVLQSTSSNLVQLHDSIRRGLDSAAPALFSVYTGTEARHGDMPCYLVSAAAMQSRAFPAFTYDPSAGHDLASRFSLEDNPQPESDWASAALEYADPDLQRVTGSVAFTLADFVACDPRYAAHFARVPHDAWNGHMVPLDEWLGLGAAATEGKVPYLLAVDGKDVLQRLVIDDKLVQAARRCLENWHRLQEFGGVHSSHAQRLLARERAAWEEEKRKEIEALRGAQPADAEPEAAGAAAAPAAAAAPVAEAAAEVEPERSPDEAYIETIRCSSCNECTNINDKMFAYNENKQAYIKDIKAGTYRQMVEAAESCQLSIIHPGKPIDPKEPGLEELIERAKPFM
jgi:hypothetical protein